jgi:hypothetical protein
MNLKLENLIEAYVSVEKYEYCIFVLVHERRKELLAVLNMSLEEIKKYEYILKVFNTKEEMVNLFNKLKLIHSDYSFSVMLTNGIISDKNQ